MRRQKPSAFSPFPVPFTCSNFKINYKFPVSLYRLQRHLSCTIAIGSQRNSVNYMQLLT
jgi:hypothetical protein